MRLVSPLIRNQSRRLKWIRCRRVTKWNLIRLALGVCQLIPTHKNKHTHAKDEIPVFKYRVDEKENGFKSEKHRRRQLVLYLWYEKIADHIFVKILQMAWDEASMNQNIAHNIFPNNLERYPRYIGRQRLFDSHSGCDINRYLRNLTLRSHQNMSKTYKTWMTRHGEWHHEKCPNTSPHAINLPKSEVAGNLTLAEEADIQLIQLVTSFEYL